MLVTTSAWDSILAGVLAEHVTSGGFSGPLYNLNLHLFQNQITITKATTWAKLTEASYSGYAAITALAWGTSILQNDGTYTILSALSTFIAQASSAFQGNTIWGWALTDTANPPNLLVAELFAQPVPIAVPGDGFGLVLEFNVNPPNTNSFGSVLA